MQDVELMVVSEFHLAALLRRVDYMRETVTSLESHIYRKHTWRAIMRSHNSREVFFVWQRLFFLGFKIFEYFFVISGLR